MLPLLGPLSKNKSNWYVLASAALSVMLLFLPQPVKGEISHLIWEILYAPFYQSGEMLKGLYQVHQENKLLRHQIAQLEVEKNILQEEHLENRRLRELLELKAGLQFEVIPAEVLARDLNFRLNTILINADGLSGVQKDSPVIDTRGLVGKVMEVFPGHAVVQLLFDPGFKVSALDQRSRVKGILSWKSGSLLEMSYVPSGDDIQVGDDIVTSGLGTIYPAGLRIGWVTSVGQDRKLLFKTIVVAPYADIFNLEELFVIKGH